MGNKEKIYEAIRKAGYKYTKDYYEKWAEIFEDELAENDSPYYESKQGFL